MSESVFGSYKQERGAHRNTVLVKTAVLSTLLCVVFAMAGCAHAPMNKPLAAMEPENGLRFSAKNWVAKDDLMVAVFFSGGGTRAAAFSYGVLKELAATPLPDNRRMLDDVVAISAVSGGSFTAAYYCLYGDRIFSDFEKDFLRRRVQESLYNHVFDPFLNVRLYSKYFARSDLAAEYYDDILFHGATFGDLGKKSAGRTPFLVINATDLKTSAAFPFTQDQFDLIGSDLASFPISRAVAASSAVPVLLTPIALRNYDGRRSEAIALWREQSDTSSLFSVFQRSFVERDKELMDSSKNPYIHLVDGGLADNLGLTGLLKEVTVSGGWAAATKPLKKAGIHHLAVIVVNAAVQASHAWALSPEAPVAKSVVLSLSNSSMNRNTDETITMMKAGLAYDEMQHPSGPGDVKIHLITVDFHGIQDPAERDFFCTIPTRFQLPPDTVMKLVAKGGELLRDSKEFRELLSSLNKEK